MFDWLRNFFRKTENKYKTDEESKAEEQEEKKKVNTKSKVPEKADDGYILVAAIDLGTSYSGYAFSFTTSPDDIKMNKNWGAEAGYQSYKTPTCVLTNPDGTFNSFGYQAESDFAETDRTELMSTDNYNLYKHFKMALHNKDGVNEDSLVTSTSGHQRKAIEIFTMTFKYLKEHMIEAINKSIAGDVDDSKIKWVITVPTMWEKTSMKFMREAAKKAGLVSSVDSKLLLLVNEATAASTFCKNLEMHNFTHGSGPNQPLQIEAYDQIVVIDAGGGTVDITIHKVYDGHYVKDVIPPTGASWGGVNVDRNFIKLIEDIFSKECIDSFKSDCPDEWLQFLLKFENVKKSFNPDSNNGRNTIRISLPYSLATNCNRYTGLPIADFIRTRNEFGVQFVAGSLIISSEAVNWLFQPVVDGIVNHVKDKVNTETVKYIFLVGGFASSQNLQKACKTLFADDKEGKNCKLFLPEEGQLSVMKGAVQFGQDPYDGTSEGNIFYKSFVWLRGYKSPCS